MAKTKLEKELKSGIASFIAYGKAKISADTFPEDITVSKSGWAYKRIGFPISVGDTNSIYVQMMGGYFKDKPQINVFNKDTNEMFKIDWDMRDNEDVLKNVANRSFIRVALEKDEKGKVIEKRFISEIDAINYLQEHLENEDDIWVSGSVEYQRYNGKIQRSFNITGIGLNVNEQEPKAELRQTYLLESTALKRNWEKEFAENKELIINAFVPQYIGKENGKEIRKTLAFPQQFTVKATDKNINNMTKVIEKFFKVSKGVVREISLRNELIHGYEQSAGNVKRTAQVQELLDLGLMTEEQLDKETTISGTAVDKTIFLRPMIKTDNGNAVILMADKYSPEALTIIDDDEDIEENNSIFNEDEDTESSSVDSIFDGMFDDDEE